MDLSNTILKISSQKDLDIIYLILSIKNSNIRPKKYLTTSLMQYCRINKYLEYYKVGDPFFIKNILMKAIKKSLWKIY